MMQAVRETGDIVRSLVDDDAGAAQQIRRGHRLQQYTQFDRQRLGMGVVHCVRLPDQGRQRRAQQIVELHGVVRSAESEVSRNDPVCRF